jgi:hypothetical protein
MGASEIRVDWRIQRAIYALRFGPPDGIDVARYAEEFELSVADTFDVFELAAFSLGMRIKWAENVGQVLH